MSWSCSEVLSGPVAARRPGARHLRHDVWVSYELRALVGPYRVAALAAMEARIAAVELPQGYGLVPVTSRVLDRLGGESARPLGDAFWFLSPAVEALARRVSRAGPIAYLEADMFGGTGSQAALAWRDGEVWLEPVATAFRWPPPDPASNWQCAFNQALRGLGVDRGEGFDEFDAVSLGMHRHTEDWQSAG
jgi:hypothetical protein